MNGSVPEVLYPSRWPRSWVIIAVVLLLAVLSVELIVPARRQSPVFDEGCHILAGYSYWTRADYGINPEHPPLVKMLAALPLLPLQLSYPSPADTFFKFAEFAGGRQFLFSNNADQIVLPARMAVASLTILAALAIFAAACEMFGRSVGMISLLLFVFEPNIIANGALVTTDMGMALFLLATVFAFYRYVKNPTLTRLVLVGVVGGFCLAAKHSGILWGPILLLLVAADVTLSPKDSRLAQAGRGRYLLRLLLSLVVAGFISVAILWAFYGFRFQARPNGLTMIPDFANYLPQMQSPGVERLLLWTARHRLLPEAYLYGLSDIRIAPRYVTPYLFGKVYPHGLWYYPLATFVIKSTLGFLLLLCICVAALLMRGVGRLREFLFLVIPSAVYLAAALASGFNHGNRYLLPLYPFLILLCACASHRLATSRREWLYVVVALLALHVISSMRAFPDYLPYANEAWGGPSNTYKFLSDSNVDWGQQLKLAKKYLDRHGVKDCWFDYYASAVAVPSYYGISCQPLPDKIAIAFGLPTPMIPAHVEGTVLISDAELLSLWGPAELNPYAQFQKMKPDDLIAGGLFVFHGQFDLPLAAANSHAYAASQFLEQGEAAEALSEAQTAVSLAPDDAASQIALGDAFAHLNRKEEARVAYERALHLAQTIDPEFQAYSAWLAHQGMAAVH